MLHKDDKNPLTGGFAHGINRVPQLFPDRCSAEVLGEVITVGAEPVMWDRVMLHHSHNACKIQCEPGMLVAWKRAVRAVEGDNAMRCSECGFCVSLDAGQIHAWQCNLTGEAWEDQTPAGIDRPCFASTEAKLGFMERLLDEVRADALAA